MLRILIMIVLISSTTFCQENDYGFTYLGENGEKIIEVTSLEPSTMYSNYYIDSVSQKLYTGIVIQRHQLVEEPVDSMCIVNGVLDGYHKTYQDIKWGVEYPSKVVYVSQELKFEVDVVNNMVDLARKSVYLNLFVDNVFYAYKANFKKRKIKLERVRRDDNIEELKLEKDRFKFKSLKELEEYFNSEKERGIISDEILKKCRRLGFFSEKPIEEPIIFGNCNKKE